MIGSSRPARTTAVNTPGRIARVAAGLCALVVMAAAAREPGSLAQELARLDAALARAEAAADAAPDDAPARLCALALAAERAGWSPDPAAPGQVLAQIAQAGQRFGPRPDLALLHAQLCLRLHDLPCVQAALGRIGPLVQSKEARLLAADLARERGELATAQAAWEALLARSRDWDVLARVAWLAARTGHDAQADALYAEAQDGLSAFELPEYAFLARERGLLALMRGRHEDAAAHYARAERALPGDWRTTDLQAEWLGAEGRFDEAIAAYQALLARAPRPEIAQALGDLYRRSGQPERAAPWHAQALAGYLASVERGEVQYLHHLAGYYADVDEDGEAALPFAARDLQLRPNFLAADQYAWALYRAGRYDEAKAASEPVLAAGAADAPLLVHAALIRLATGDAQQGRALLARAAAVNPRYEAFHAHR